MAEWSNAAVLKTVEGHTSGGSNPSFSAKPSVTHLVFLFLDNYPRVFLIILNLTLRIRHIKKEFGSINSYYTELNEFTSIITNYIALCYH